MLRVIVKFPKIKKWNENRFFSPTNFFNDSCHAKLLLDLCILGEGNLSYHIIKPQY